MRKGKIVLVIGMNGVGLMPTDPRTARLLLRQHKAVVYRNTPFTIKLTYKTGCATQPTVLGIDTGTQHIGVAVVSGDRVLLKSEWELRSTMEKRKLLESRKSMRRSRRYRNTPYRHPKYRPHAKRTYSEQAVMRNGHTTHWKKEISEYTTDRQDGWLPPTVQSKVNHHVQIISRYKEALPPSCTVRLELGRFDMAHMQDPNIRGVEYQHGPMYEFENIKAYVLARQQYKCPICGRKFGSVRKEDSTVVKARLHHLDYRSKGATNNPERLVMVCDHCHTAAEHADGGALEKMRKSAAKGVRGMRDATMMNIVAVRLQNAFPDAQITYGNITKADREMLRLEKSHANDAVAIAMHSNIVIDGDLSICDADFTTLYQQHRKKKRSLHEANPRKGRKEPNHEARRNRKNTKQAAGICLLDKIAVNKEVGIVTGFSGTSFRAITSSGMYVGASAKNSQPTVPCNRANVVHHNNNWIEIRT